MRLRLRQFGTIAARRGRHPRGMTSIAWRWLRGLVIALGVLVGFLAIIQVVPYGRAHSNPRTTGEPVWDSPRTRELASRACFDCHSNNTRWPWYTHVAPFSWVVQFDVDSGREVVNFSEWDRHFALAEYAGKRVRSGMMPPYKYRLAHPEANLSAAETQELARGLDATLAPGEASR